MAAGIVTRLPRDDGGRRSPREGAARRRVSGDEAGCLTWVRAAPPGAEPWRSDTIDVVARTHLLGLVALAALPVACSSTVVGEGDGTQVRTFDIAVGATATLVLGDPRCVNNPPPAYGCLSGRLLESVQKAEILGDGSLTVVRSRIDDVRRRILVDVKANGPGAGTLRVDYTDRLDGAKHDELLVRALPITHVDEKVGCQFERGLPESTRYPVSRGSRVVVGLTAMNEERPLLSGSLDLVVDRGGLDPVVVVDGDEGTVVRTVEPGQQGAFTWKLAGSRTKELTFDVYDPETVGVLVTPGEHAVSVRPAVNGVPTCFYGGNGRAMTRVSDGACKLIVGDFEVDGDLPVSLARGGETFAVEGAGRCTIESRIASGPPGSTSVDGRPMPVTEKPTTGDAVGTQPIERGGTLAKRDACVRVTKISNGKCEAINAGGYFVLPDGDCIIDFDWFADPYEDDKANTNPVGVGLLAELRVGLKLKLFGLLTLKPLVPNALRVGTTALAVESLGCNNSSSYEALAIRPPSAGHHGVRFTADNAPEPLDYDVEARQVGRISYLREKLDTREALGTTSSYHFLRSELDLKLAYFDSGGAPLRGVGPVRVSTTDAAANVVLRSDAAEVFTGTAPNRVTLASPAAPKAHVLEVVDTSAVATVGGIDSPKAGSSGTVCVEPFAQAASGQRIYGKSPIRPRLSFAGGDACGMVGGVLADTTIDIGRGEICATPAVSKPATEVRIAWGSATTTWSCAPR